MSKTRKMILNNLRDAIYENDNIDDEQTKTYSEDEDYEQPKLRREKKSDYDGYEEEEDDEEEYIKPRPRPRQKTRERKIPRRLRTPERKPERERREPEKKKRTNNKLMKFNECLRKLKTENPNMSHREAQKNMRQIINQLNANGYEDPEGTFMKMTKN